MMNARSAAVLIASLTLLSVDVFSQSNQVPDNIELQVLKDLFDSLGGPSWKNKTNWPTGGNWPANTTSEQFGRWYGINVTNGDVTSIILNGNNLSGRLPSSIGMLSRLQAVNLIYNQISGPLPDRMRDLGRLTALLISNNRLNGGLSVLCNLPGLQYLQADGNQFNGGIPACLGNLTELRILYLENNPLGGTIPDVFGRMTHLTDLRLGDDQLTGSLPASLGIVGSPLSRLILRNNKLKGKIPSTYANLTALSEVYLNSNELSGDLPSFVGKWTNLLSLYINNNRFTGDFPPGIVSKRATSIVASNNYFTSLPASLLSLPSLTIIYFDNNELSSVPDFGVYQNRLNLTLLLQNNHLDFSQLERHLGKGIKTLTQTPQKHINDSPTMSFTIGDKLLIDARAATVNTTIRWEKLDQNGVSWSVLNNDEDNAQSTFTRNLSTKMDAGTYRWTSTNSIIPAIIIQSDPIVVKAGQGFTLDKWCFQYKYDSRRRMTHKKVPGVDWVYMVYDDRDRLVMMQDGEQRKSNKWLVTKYDRLNRPAVTALYTHNGYASQQEMTDLVNSRLFSESYSGEGISGYTNTVFPMTNLEILTATYYDEYSFVGNRSDLSYLNGQLASQSKNVSMASGMITGTKIKVLDVPYYLTSVNYYDEQGRVVQTVSENYDAGIDRVTNQYDFTGKVIATRNTHSVRDLHWQNVEMMQVEGNLLRRVSSGGYGGGSSVEYIPALADGWAEATVTEVTEWRYWGLSDVDADRSPSSIDYCFYLFGPTLQVLENGVLKKSVANLASGDRLRISRTGTTVRYYRNGALIYTSLTPSSTLLRADVSLWSNLSTILNINLSAASSTQTTLREFDYDHAGRLITTRHCMNDGDTILLSKHEYNELGQLIDKKLHGKADGDFSQSIDYRYNIRGWLASINGASVDADGNDGDPDSKRDLFGVDLSYDQEQAGLNNGTEFNGNISAIKWRVNLGLDDTTMRAYTFTYDGMNRLMGSRPKVYDTRWKNQSAFYEDSLRYDLNGNIKTLRRTAMKGSIMDRLTYQYEGNQLLKVDDSGDPSKGFVEGNNVWEDYTYDRNGNMLTDNNKGVTVFYNILNLPRSVLRSGRGTIEYYYDATGRKLSQVVKDISGAPKKTTGYHGDFIYENDTLKFANTGEGRVMLKGEPEYQYHLKDHLGNVRMTFTTRNEVNESLANFESPTNDFLYYDKVVKINSALFDHTNEGQTFYSMRLNGSRNERVSLVKSLNVLPGDTVRMEVYAKYLDTNSSDWSAALNAFVGSIASGMAPAGTFVDGGGAAGAVGITIPWSGFLDKSSQTGAAPKAYLNYLIFDRDYNFIDGEAICLSTEAREYGQDGPHERLAATLLIRKPGYVYIYLSNDNAAMGHEQVDVFFDDFKVEHVKSPVVQSQGYYPFGLTFNDYQREGSLVSQYKFQGQEHQDELDLGWDSFKWRNHQPEIGRFFNIDPLSEKYYYNSPYAFSENHVTTHIELEGLEKVGINYDGLEDALDRAAVNTTIVERSGSSIKVSSLDGKGGVMNSTTIALPSKNKQGEVSDKSAKTIGEVAMSANDKQIRISSVRRNASDQGRAMMQNLIGTGRGQGVAAQRALYHGKPGEQVINTFTKYKALQGIASHFGGSVTNTQIQNALVTTITELGVQNVTNHASLNPQLNVIDVSPASVENNAGFSNAAKGHPSIEKFIPYPQDPGNHFEIRN
jgi:RHS repeat-associated protein